MLRQYFPPEVGAPQTRLAAVAHEGWLTEISRMAVLLARTEFVGEIEAERLLRLCTKLAARA